MSDLNVYTTSQINALTPITGDMVVDSDLNAVKLYDGSAWRVFNSDSVVGFENRWGASLDGSSYLQCGNITALNSVANASFSFWYKTSEASTAQVTLIGDSSNGLAAYQYTNGNMYIHSFVSSLAHSISNPTSGVWHHIACTFEASASKAYLDGSLVSTVDHGDVTASICGNSFSIGILPGYSNTLGGTKLVDEVALFTSTLSAADITKIYNGTAPNGKPTDLTLAASYDTANQEQNLAGYWRMGGDSSDSPVDAGDITGITNTANPGTNDATTVANSQPTFSALASSETIYV